MGNACCAEPKPDIQAKRSMDEEFFKLHVDAGHMNDRRRSFVDRLYTILGDETTLDAAAMAKAFDADAHPDVVAGNRSAADVRAELHEALAAGGGPVTRQLFEDYYDLQSITVDRDEQFEALVRSSWIALVRQKAAARKKRGGGAHSNSCLRYRPCADVRGLEGRLALPRRRPLVGVAVREVAEGGARLRRLLRRRGHAAHALAEVVLGRVVVAVEAALARVGRRRRRRPVVAAAAVRVVVVVARAG